MTTQTRTDTHETRYSSPSASSSITISGNLRDWTIGLVLALSIAGNLFAGWRFSRAEQAEDLKRYDLDFFVRNEFSPLKATVESHEKLITIMGCKEK